MSNAIASTSNARLASRGARLRPVGIDDEQYPLHAQHHSLMKSFYQGVV
jgi:hypothetical protein